MVPQTITYQPRPALHLFPKVFVGKLGSVTRRFAPRPHLLSSVGLLLVGLGIPMLMLLELMPITLFLGMASFALIATGGLLFLYYL